MKKVLTSPDEPWPNRDQTHRSVDLTHACQEHETVMRECAEALGASTTRIVHHSVGSMIVKMESLIDSLRKQLAESDVAAEENTGRLLARLQELEMELARLEHLADAQAKELEQIRLFQERTAQKVETLSESLIQRHVRDPLLKQFAAIFSNLALPEGGDESAPAVIDNVREDIRRMLEQIGIELIEPGEGSGLIPAEHRPLSTEETTSKRRDRKIARCFRCGLKAADRVLQPAMVSVYRWNKPEPMATEPTSLSEKTLGQPQTQ
jgi:molecular chaperone GrpE (heat shock protein)